MAAIIGVIMYLTVLVGGVAVTMSTPTGSNPGGIVVVDTQENN
jgi:hypothetical protein